MSETKTVQALSQHPEVWEQLEDIKRAHKVKVEHPKGAKRHAIMVGIALITGVVFGGAMALAASGIH